MPRHYTYRRWTAAEDRCLEELTLAGEPGAQIARLLGRTPMSVEKRRTALGVRRARTWTKWLALVQVPHSNVQLAELVARTPNMVAHAKAELRKLGYRVWDARLRRLR